MKKYTKDALLMAVLVVVLVGTGFFSAGMALMKSNVFLEGSSLNGIDISGMTPEQAEKAVLQQEREKIVPVNFQIICEGKTLRLNDANSGRSSDAEELIHNYLFNLYEGSAAEKYDTLLAFRKNVIVDYSFEYDIEIIQRTIADFAVQFEQPAIDATINTDDGSPQLQYISEQHGKYLDVVESSELVRKLLMNGEGGGLELRLKDSEPDISMDMLQQQVQLIGNCSTEITDERQIRNVDAIIKQLNGTVIQPRELLSLNELTGPRDGKNGYVRLAQETTEELDEYGAGVSQVAGMLYYASLLADMEIVERNAQSVPTAYLQPGLDAIIDIATNKDLIVKNISDMPAYIFANRQDMKLEVSIYGVLPKPGRSIKVETEVLEWIPPGEPEYVYDEDTEKGEKQLQREAREGANVIVSRCYYSDEGGDLVDKKRVSSDSYQPVKAIYRVGDESVSGK